MTTIPIAPGEPTIRWGMIYTGPRDNLVTAIVCGGPRSEMSPEGKRTSWATLDGTCDNPPCFIPELALLAQIALADMGVEMKEFDPDRVVAVHE